MPSLGVIIVLVFSQVIYPVNYLRNVAINNTNTKFMFLTDIDFVPVVGTHNMLLEDLQLVVEGHKQVHVLSILGDEQHRVEGYKQENTRLRIKLIKLSKQSIRLWSNIRVPMGSHVTRIALSRPLQ